MLNASLVRATRRDDMLRLRKWKRGERERAASIAHQLIEIAKNSVGKKRAEFVTRLGQVDIESKEQKLADGLRKLVTDRCSFGAPADLSAPELRADIFVKAAALRMSDEEYNREAVLVSVAEKRGFTAEQVESWMFSDLKEEQLLNDFEDVDPVRLVELYDLAQEQAVLLKAERVVVTIRCKDPKTYRYFFNKLKFFRLLFTIEPLENGYRINIDGPMSMFGAATKYGLQMALILPALRACDHYAMRASLRWGKERRRVGFESEKPKKAETEAVQEDSLATPLKVLFDKAATKKKPKITLSRCDKILPVPGLGVCVPDLTAAIGKKEVHLELLGYWSRDAVFKRVEMVEKGLAEPVIFLVPQRLRVSEEVLPDDLPASLYVFKGVISLATIEKRVAELLVSDSKT